MIAEINAPFKPSLVVLDGIEAFVDGGPMTGKRAKANVFLASADRVAIDAVGVAILKSLGSNGQIMGTKIFAQEQIARAVELGLGASSPSEIELVAVGDQSRESSHPRARNPIKRIAEREGSNSTVFFYLLVAQGKTCRAPRVNAGLKFREAFHVSVIILSAAPIPSRTIWTWFDDIVRRDASPGFKFRNQVFCVLGIPVFVRIDKDKIKRARELLD